MLLLSCVDDPNNKPRNHHDSVIPLYIHPKPNKKSLLVFSTLHLHSVQNVSAHLQASLFCAYLHTQALGGSQSDSRHYTSPEIRRRWIHAAPGYFIRNLRRTLFFFSRSWSLDFLHCAWRAPLRTWVGWYLEICEDGTGAAHMEIIGMPFFFLVIRGLGLLVEYGRYPVESWTKENAVVRSGFAAKEKKE